MAFEVKKVVSRNWIRSAIASMLLACVFCSCGADRELPLMRFVPQESCAILSVEWPALKANNDFRRLFKAKELEDSLRRLQIKEESIRTIVVFSGVDSEEISGLLVRGVFDSQAIAAELKTHAWNEESLDGNKVYVHAAEYIALPSNHTLFAGTREAV